MSDTETILRASEPDADAELVRAASAGDMDAAGRFLSRHRVLLASLARRVAHGQVDHEELLSESVLHLLERWSAGTGPDEGVIGYLVRSMRNQLIDELRSPRRYVHPIHDIEREREPLALDDLSEIESEAEAHVIRQALGLLTFDQRATLLGIIVEGQKPADVAAIVGRSAPAVSNLFQRSRVALRRATLVVMLSTGGDDCQDNAHRIPKAPLPDPGQHALHDRGMRHVLRCAECTTRWRRWALGDVGVVTRAPRITTWPARGARDLRARTAIR